MSHSRCACLSVCLCVSTAVVSRWSSHCSSVRRTCLASARESTRNCATVASTLERPTDICPRLLPTGFFLVSSTPGQTHTGTDAHSLLHKQTQFDFLVFPECRSHSHSELLTQSHETLSPGYVDTLQLVSRSVSFFFFFFLMQTWKELLTWPPTDLLPRMLDQNTSVLILNSVIKHPENFNPSSSSLTEDADDGAVWTNRERLCLPGGVAFSHRVDFLSWKILRTVLCWIHSSNMPINIHINEVELCDPVDQLFTLYLNTWVGYI